MVNPREAIVPDPKPSRFLLYGTLILGVITGLMIESDCPCTDWQHPLLRLMAEKSLGVVVGTAFWSFVLIIGYHAYYFCKSLFHHPR